MTIARNAATLALGFTALMLQVGSVDGADPLRWSSFQNQGQLVQDQATLPSTWSADQGIAWQAKIIGYGQSTPVVGNDLIFVTSTSGENKEKYHLTAFALESGTQVWTVEFPNPTPTPNNAYVSRAAPTPVVDKQGIVCLFEGGIVAAVDFSGKVRWQKNLVADYGPIVSRHGIGGSVEQNAELAFVWIERDAEPYLLAVNKQTGQEQWKVAGLGATSWSTPRLIPVNDGFHLVCSASGLVAGFDPSTGQKLWELRDVSGNTTATPIPAGNARFVLGASEGRGEEATGNAAESNGLVQINATADGYQAAFVWRAKKATSSFGSPIVAGDRVYFVNRTGVIYCLDAKTGEELANLRGKAGSIWATPLVANNRLYLFGKSGVTSVYSLGDRLEPLAENTLWQAAPAAGAGPGDFSGPVLYAGVAAEPYLLLRRGDVLYAVK